MLLHQSKLLFRFAVVPYVHGQVDRRTHNDAFINPGYKEDVFLVDQYFQNTRYLVLVTAFAAFPFGAHSFADTSDLTPTELAYFEGNTRQPATFNTIPITHITPQFKKVSLALDAKSIDTHVTNQSVAQFGITDDLSMKGYTASPFLALSLSRLGLGINYESGKRTLKSTNASNSYESIRLSTMDYSGLGIYFYFIPFQKAGSWRLSTVVGAKQLNAKHETSTTQLGTTFNSTKTDYTVSKVNYGLNFRYQMSPKIALIPWVDYLTVDVNEGADTVSTIFNADLDLFWIERPDLLYGLDVTYRIGQAEIHLGGAISLLNSVGQSTVESQTYKFDDKRTFNISFSFDFKD